VASRSRQHRAGGARRAGPQRRAGGERRTSAGPGTAVEQAADEQAAVEAWAVDQAAGEAASDAGSESRPGRHRAGPPIGLPATGAGLFTWSVLDYAARHPGRAISVIQAGCATAGADLDFAALRASHCTATLTLLDDDNQVTREAVTAPAAVAARPELAAAVLGDLRTAPLVPRSADVVHCCLLLDRISNAELVLGRLVDALRPGGLLLLRVADRYSAAGFLDRRLPGPLRARSWRSRRPGEPGPYPASYEPVTSGPGIRLFTARHGLVISRREASSHLDQGRRHPVIRCSRWLVAAASRGRLTAAHDELRYVIRKPEDQFARVL
jgi:SAM-dependent methyltransferase